MTSNFQFMYDNNDCFKDSCDSRWWTNFNFKEKLPFARDRWVECYFWGLGLYFEPQYALARTILTKVFSLMIVLDDIYDVYGTLEEVTLFTDAIDR